MALITCPECGKEISDCAAACPHCGKPMNSYYMEMPKQKKSKGWLWAVVILVVVAGFLTLTCPNKEAHRERMSSEISALILSEMKDSGGFAQLFASAVVGPLVDHLLDEMLVVDSYGI